MSAKAAAAGCEAVIAELVAAVKERKSALESAAKKEGKKDYALSKEQVRALLQQEWDNIATSRLIAAALAEASDALGV